MRNIRSIEMDRRSREEQLPGFDPAFPYIATRAELNRYNEPFVPWHWHGAVELFYVESGALEYTTPHGSHVFPAGSGGFVNAGVLHTSRPLPGGEETVQLLHLFDPALLGEPDSRIWHRYILPLTASATELVFLAPKNPAHAAILEEIRNAFQLSEQEAGYELLLREKLSRIWMELLELSEYETDRRGSDSQIKLLMAYVQENYAQALNVEQLAQVAHISHRSCFRLFRESLHMSPGDYVRGVRLRQACRLLRETDRPVTDIGYACGLGSASYFGKVFREAMGHTPAEYRRIWHDRDILGRV